MTWRKGSQWKTSWNRRRSYGQQDPVEMWFIDLGGSGGGYETALATPFPFQNATFWVGMVVGVRDSATVALRQLAGGPTGIGVSVTLDTVFGDVATFEDFASAARVVEGSTTQYLPSNPEAGAAVVILVTATPEDSGTRMNLWMDGGLRQTLLTTAPLVPGAADARLVQIGAAGNTFNGFAGGTTLPTDAEILGWFQDVKNNADIQAIAGKTTDLISASSVAPLAPAVIPNGAGGQVFTSFSGTQNNALLPSVFNY